MGEIRILRATMADRPRIVAFLRVAFYPDEPLNIAMGLTTEPSDADVDHSLQSLPQGNSLIALIGEDIVAVAINGEVTDNEANVRQKLCDECKCPDFVAFLKFWVHVEQTADIWRKNGVTRALDLEILAVGAAARGRGIGRRLLVESMALAKELGYQNMRMDCSSFYAAKLAELQGMKCVFELPFADYKNDAGEPVFKISPPHEALKIYMQTL